jgi:hypothetical protein
MMFDGTTVALLLGLGLAYLLTIIALPAVGIWLMLRRPRLRWLGAAMLLGVLVWSFGPFVYGQIQLQQARAPVDALQLPPGDLSVQGTSVVIVTTGGAGDCSGLCDDLLQSGLVDEVLVIEAYYDFDLERLATDPLGALVDDGATLWRAVLGAPEEGFGPYRFPEVEQLPLQGRPEADLVILEDVGGFVTHEAREVLLPGLEDPTEGRRDRQIIDALHIWTGWPDNVRQEPAQARLVTVEVRWPPVVAWFLGPNVTYLPESFRHEVIGDWLCREGDQRPDYCPGGS